MVPKFGGVGSVVFRHLVCDMHSHKFFAKSEEGHKFVITPLCGDLMRSLVGELTDDFGADAADAGAGTFNCAEAMLKRLCHFFWTWLS